MDWNPPGRTETVTLDGSGRAIGFAPQQAIGNRGSATITLVRTDGKRVTLAAGYGATVAQDADGRFTSISEPYLVQPDE